MKGASMIGASNLENLTEQIKTDLAAANNDRISVASMVVHLRQPLREALHRGVTYQAVAQIFRRHGLPATADGIRIALRRNVRTKAARAQSRIDHQVGLESIGQDRTLDTNIAPVLAPRIR